MYQTLSPYINTATDEHNYIDAHDTQTYTHLKTYKHAYTCVFVSICKKDRQKYI